MFDEPPSMLMTAVFEPTTDYRVELRRVWNQGRPLLVVCMLNPSTADAHANDPTILALIWFATLWGYGGLIVVNLYSYCSSTPDALRRVADPVGPENDTYVRRALDYAKSHTNHVLVAWGNGGDTERVVWFVKEALARGIELICLGVTKDGSPKHPTARGQHRIVRTKQPELWTSH